MAGKGAYEIRKIPELKVSQAVDANGVFVMVPSELIPKLQEHYFFHVWNEISVIENGIARKEVRLMCSWDTTEHDIMGFVELARNI